SPSGEILHSLGPEYYDNSVPFEGITIDYLNSLVGLSGGELDITFTHGSKGALKVHPESTYMAVIQDVEDGVVDMGASQFWVTGERLNMTKFTMPLGMFFSSHREDYGLCFMQPSHWVFITLAYDRTVLVIEKPGVQSSLSSQTGKVFEPFTVGTWIVVVCVIASAALLSTWFHVPSKKVLTKRQERQRANGQKQPKKEKILTYARLVVDEFLQKSIYFCSAGVEQDAGSSLPQKVLMLGFASFILIVVSSYVANLAATLTKSALESHVSTMEMAVAKNMTICANSDLQEELEIRWPTANFVWYQTTNETYSFFLDYDEGNCDAMASSENDVLLSDSELGYEYCKRDLVFTDSVVLEYVSS
ncbi:hypothetical protein ACHAXR_003059, partial [Thalassiosira sp. AJA248-18]